MTLDHALAVVADGCNGNDNPLIPEALAMLRSADVRVVERACGTGDYFISQHGTSLTAEDTPCKGTIRPV